MSEFRSTATVLRLFVTVGVLIMAVGLILNSTDVLTIGTAITICAPIAGVVAAGITLARAEDWGWLEVTAVLLLIIAIGIVISLF